MSNKSRETAAMKNALAVIFTLAVLAIGGIYLYQARQLEARKAEIATLRQQAEAQAKQLEAAQEAKDRLRQQRLDLAENLDTTSSALENARELAAIASSNAAVAAAKAEQAEASGKGLKGLGGAVAKMLENPEMKKMIAQQQRVMVDMMYGPLFKELGLAPADAEKFKEMLLAQQMRGVDQAMGMLGDQTDPKAKAEAAKAMADAAKQSEEDIKAFLGEERYAYYKDYKESLGERMQLNQFTQQLANGEHPLSPDQQSTMLNIMKEERKAMAMEFADLGWSGSQPSNPQDALDSDKLSKYLDLQQNLNQHVYDRARSALQPAQLDAFGTAQTNQISIQRLGIKMMQSMMEDRQPADGEIRSNP